MIDRKVMLRAAQLFEQENPGRHLVAKSQVRVLGSNTPPLGAGAEEYGIYVERAREQFTR